MVITDREDEETTELYIKEALRLKENKPSKKEKEQVEEEDDEDDDDNEQETLDDIFLS